MHLLKGLIHRKRASSAPIPSRTASIALAVVLAFASLPVHTEAYAQIPVMPPSEPLAPRSWEECWAIRDQFNLELGELAQKYRLKYLELLRESDSPARQAISAELASIRAEMKELRQQSRAVVERCVARVEAYKAAERRKQEEERQRARDEQARQAQAERTAESIDNLPRTAMDAMTSGSGKALSKLLSKFSTTGEQRALASGLSILGNIDGMQESPQGPLGQLESGAQRARWIASKYGTLHPLSNTLTRLAISGIIDINRSALGDLDAALNQFDAEQRRNSLAARLEAHNAYVYRLLSEDPLAPPAEHQDLTSTLDLAREQAEAMITRRAEPARAAMEQAAAARAAQRAAAARAAERERSSRSGGGSTPRANTSRSCSDLIAQSWRVLPSGAAREGEGRNSPRMQRVESICREVFQRCGRDAVRQCRTGSLMWSYEWD